MRPPCVAFVRTAIPNWTATSIGGAVKVENMSSTVSNRQLTEWNASAFDAWVAQNATLPNGEHTLTFDYKSSARASNAYFSVKNHGAQVQIGPQPKSLEWMTTSVMFEVSTGTVRIGAWLGGTGGQWLNLDNVSIRRN